MISQGVARPLSQTGAPHRAPEGDQPEAAPEVAGRESGLGTWPLLALIVFLAFVARFSSIGADTHWLVALGDHVLETGRVPEGLPFAAAPTPGWPNVPVLAEVCFAVLHRFGDVGLVLAQLAADAVALVLLALGARRCGASQRATAAALLLVALGALPALVVVRLQLLSLVPFALLLMVLRSEHRRPSHRVWLLVPLLLVWSNLHGAVLMGFAVTGCYLAFSRLRLEPMRAIAVGLASFAALWITPAGLRTGEYYVGVLGNEAAQRGTDLWARPSPDNAFDVLMVTSSLLLVLLALRRRLPLWEYVALAGLALGTATAARHGVWLLFLAAAPAAAGMFRRGQPHPPTGERRGRPWVVVALGLALVPLVLARGESVSPARADTIRSIVVSAGGRTVLAPEPLAESLASAGARVWVANPIDAFSRADQAAYLDFLSGVAGGAQALSQSSVVVVEPGSRSALLVEDNPTFHHDATIDGWDVYVRVLARQ